LPLNALIVEIADAISTASQSLERIPGQRELAKPPLTAPEGEQHKEALQEMERGEGVPKVVVDIDLRFRELKAAVPLFTNEMSYVSNALVRPIVAFMK
jgi:mitochondrial distribution and morphology protein 31